MYGLIKYDAETHPQSIYGHMWTYLNIYGHIYPQPLVAGGEGLQCFGDLRKMTSWDLLSMYTVKLLMFYRFEASLDLFQKVDILSN